MKYSISMAVVIILLSTHSFADENKSKANMTQLDTNNIYHYDGNIYSLSSVKTIKNVFIKCIYKNGMIIGDVKGAQWEKINKNGEPVN